MRNIQCNTTSVHKMGGKRKSYTATLSNFFFLQMREFWHFCTLEKWFKEQDTFLQLKFNFNL